MTRKWTKRLAASAALAALLCITCLTVPAAADSTLPDLNERGSISVTLYSGETKAADGALTLYRAADLVLEDSNLYYAPAEEFSGFEGTLDTENAGLADRLAAYVSENGVTGREKDVSREGKVFFEDLAPGLYLMIQTTPSGGYYPVNPFLVTVPFQQDGVWVYDVDASPKLELSPMPEETPGPSETPGTGETPTPFITTTTGGGTPGTTGGGMPTSAGPLPQTGQLNWPVPVLTAAGALLVLAGIILTWKKKNADCSARLKAAGS